MKRGTNTAASLALLFGLLVIIPFSVAAGIFALVQIRKSGEKGKYQAIAGLLVSCLWIAIGVQLFADRDTDAARDAPGPVITRLQVGDCISEVRPGAVEQPRAMPCDQPNWGEVFAFFDLPGGNYPDRAAMYAAATKGCSARYKPTAEPVPPLLFYLYPAPASWKAGDRRLTCLLGPK